jgi:hypothetical protein
MVPSATPPAIEVRDERENTEGRRIGCGNVSKRNEDQDTHRWRAMNWTKSFEVALRAYVGVFGVFGFHSGLCVLTPGARRNASPRWAAIIIAFLE